ASRCRRTGPTWPRPFTRRAGTCCRRPRRWWIVFTSPRSSTRRPTASEKKITREYKAKLSKAERKEFRSLMGEFRRHPQELTKEDQQKLEALFGALPQLRTLYEFRVRFQQIFDKDWDRGRAHRALIGLFFDMLDNFPELEAFIRTFEAWQEEI